MKPILIFIPLVLIYSLFSQKAARSIITAPMIFTLVGGLSVFMMPALDLSGVSLVLFLTLAEIGLVLLLFTDASRADLGVLRQIGSLPARLLSVGLLLTIFLGALVAKLLFPEISLWEAGIIGAILAPTDAGLGQPVVTDSRVPHEIREALNVEAGLNDGLCVPFLLFFMALAGGTLVEGVGHSTQVSGFGEYLFDQLLIGGLLGASVGVIGGWLLGQASRNGWIAESWHQLGLLTLPILTMFLAEELNSSMFIAAFVSGLAVQWGFKEAGKHSVEFAEESGQLLNLSVFMLFGIFVARAWQQFDLMHLIYAVLSLTIIRIFPVVIALVGTKLSWSTRFFIGWFGPRGLASIVLGLVFLEESRLANNSTIQLIVMMTVFLSILAHGFSTRPGIAWFSSRSGAGN